MGFFQACVESRGKPDLEYFSVGSHPAVPILIHMRKYGVLVNIQCKIMDADLESAIPYGSHSSTNKELYLVRTDLAEKLQAGNVDIFLLAAICHLQKLWLSHLMRSPKPAANLG